MKIDRPYPLPGLEGIAPATPNDTVACRQMVYAIRYHDIPIDVVADPVSTSAIL